MSRKLGIAFGLATHALFGVAVWYLFWFLKDGAAEDTARTRPRCLAIPSCRSVRWAKSISKRQRTSAIDLYQGVPAFRRKA
jgi:hypothetical protein